MQTVESAAGGRAGRHAVPAFTCGAIVDVPSVPRFLQNAIDKAELVVAGLSDGTVGHPLTALAIFAFVNLPPFAL